MIFLINTLSIFYNFAFWIVLTANVIVNILQFATNDKCQFSVLNIFVILLHKIIE